MKWVKLFCKAKLATKKVETFSKKKNKPSSSSIMPISVALVRAHAPAWVAFFLDEQKWSWEQLRWFLVYAGAFIDEKSDGMDYQRVCVLAGSNAGQVARILFPDTPWVYPSLNSVFAMHLCLHPDLEDHGFYIQPSHVILNGYQHFWPSYEQLVSRGHVIVPIPGQLHYEALWRSNIMTVLDSQSPSAIDMAYFMGHTAMFPLCTSALLLDAAFIARLHAEKTSFLQLCIDSQHEFVSAPAPSNAPHSSNFVPWCIGPLQFAVDQVLQHTPLARDIVTAILMPYLDDESPYGVRWPVSA